MQAIFQATYDEEWCSALYDCYESGDPSVLDELLRKICPLIRRNYNSIVGGSLQGDQASVEADALQEVYRVVEDEVVPNHHPAVFTKYLSTVISRSIFDSCTELKTQIFDYGKSASRPYSGQLIPQFAVEARIYEAQIRRNIRNTVVTKIRFIRDEGRACIFILECLLGYKSVDPKFAKRRFNLSSVRYKYLSRYIKILIKAEVYEQRERDRKSGAFASIWTSSGSVLCTTS